MHASVHPGSNCFWGLKFTQELPVEIDISHIYPMRDMLYLQKSNKASSFRSLKASRAEIESLLSSDQTY